MVALFIFLWMYTVLKKVLDYANFKFQLGEPPSIEPLAGRNMLKSSLTLPG